jgi:hypothetical protein
VRDAPTHCDTTGAVFALSGPQEIILANASLP